jgi:hypothetical protein
MTDISPEILEEVEACIQKIKVFQQGHDRRISKFIKKRRKGHDRIDALEEFGLVIPEDFRALYYNYDGVTPGGSLSWWEWGVFFEFYWSPIDFLVSANKIMRLEKQNPLTDRLDAFEAPSAKALQLAPKLEKDGKIPLVMTLGTLSRNAYIAFDSTLDMLRSVCAAQDAGILTFEEEGNSDSDRNRHETYYDLKELWDVIHHFNTRANYWSKAIADELDWDRIHVELPKNGVIKLDPEVNKIILGE